MIFQIETHLIELLLTWLASAAGLSLTFTARQSQREQSVLMFPHVRTSPARVHLHQPRPAELGFSPYGVHVSPGPNEYRVQEIHQIRARKDYSNYTLRFPLLLYKEKKLKPKFFFFKIRMKMQAHVFLKSIQPKERRAFSFRRHTVGTVFVHRLLQVVLDLHEMSLWQTLKGDFFLPFVKRQCLCYTFFKKRLNILCCFLKWYFTEW